MKLIAYLTVLLSIAAKGAIQGCPPMYTCLPWDRDGIYGLLYCPQGGIFADEWAVRTFKGECGNGKKDNEFYIETPNFSSGLNCCPTEYIYIEHDQERSAELSCNRKEEVIESVFFIWNSGSDCQTVDIPRELSDPMRKACVGKGSCTLTNIPKSTCDDGVAIRYYCSYDFDNKDNLPFKQADPSTSTKRRLQRHHGGGAFNNGNTNTGSNTGVVSTLETVIANCNGGRIQLINTCSIAAQSVCNGQPSCYYPITTQNSPECGNYASYGYQCY